MLGELFCILNTSVEYISKEIFLRIFIKWFIQNLHELNSFFFVLRLFVFIFKNEGLHFWFIVLYNKNAFVNQFSKI